MRPWSSRAERMPFRGQYLWLRVREHFVPATEPFRCSFNEGDGRRGGGLPEWLSCRSIRIYFLPPFVARDAEHRCYARPQNENNSRKAACASIYIPEPSCLHPDVSTRLLCSPSRRSRNPTFERARRLRLMRTNCALLLSNVYSYCDGNGNRNMLCHILEKSNFFRRIKCSNF